MATPWFLLSCGGWMAARGQASFEWPARIRNRGDRARGTPKAATAATSPSQVRPGLVQQLICRLDARSDRPVVDVFACVVDEISLAAQCVEDRHAPSVDAERQRGAP